MVRPLKRTAATRLAGTLRNRTVSLAGVRFSPSGFRELVDYVWRGGWPRWRDDDPPGYVREMKAAVDASGHWVFS